MCTPFALLRGRRDPYHRRGLGVGLTVGAWSPRCRSSSVTGRYGLGGLPAQPVKLAALEALDHSGDRARAPGLRWARSNCPGCCRCSLHGRTDAVVMGLDGFPPPTGRRLAITHYSFDVMVGIGFGLLGALGGSWALVAVLATVIV